MYLNNLFIFKTTSPISAYGGGGGGGGGSTGFNDPAFGLSVGCCGMGGKSAGLSLAPKLEAMSRIAVAACPASPSAGEVTSSSPLAVTSSLRAFSAGGVSANCLLIWVS